MGIKSIDEARAEIGLDPLGMGPAIFTGNGCVFIDELKNPEIRAQLMGMGAPPGVAPGGAMGGAPGAAAGSGFDFMTQLFDELYKHQGLVELRKTAPDAVAIAEAAEARV